MFPAVVVIAGGSFLILFLTALRLRGLPSGLEFPSRGVRLPDEHLDKLLFSRTIELARGVRSPGEVVVLRDGELRSGLTGDTFVLRRPVSMLSVSTHEFSLLLDGCSAIKFNDSGKLD